MRISTSLIFYFAISFSTLFILFTPKAEGMSSLSEFRDDMGITRADRVHGIRNLLLCIPLKKTDTQDLAVSNIGDRRVGEKKDDGKEDKRMTEIEAVVYLISEYFPDIISLNLRFNLFSRLPKSVDTLTKLRKLDLSCNALTDLPESICSLPKLEILDISWNQLYRLPESIGNLKSLRYLNLFRNQLKELPDSVCDLTNLEVLNLKGNGHEELAEAIKILEAKNPKFKIEHDHVISILNLEAELISPDLSDLESDL